MVRIAGKARESTSRLELVKASRETGAASCSSEAPRRRAVPVETATETVRLRSMGKVVRLPRQGYLRIATPPGAARTVSWSDACGIPARPTHACRGGCPCVDVVARTRGAGPGLFYPLLPPRSRSYATALRSDRGVSLQVGERSLLRSCPRPRPGNGAGVPLTGMTR